MFRELPSLIKLKYSLALASLLALVSCTEFQEPNLTESGIDILLPRDSLQTGLLNQHFYWYALDEALGYEVQIARPNFQNILQLVLDTTMEGTEFRYTLQPGTYEWRIRAYNNSSVTPYQYRILTIDSSLNLSAQMVLLTDPPQNDTLRIMNPLLRWQALYSAEEYELEIFQGGSNGLLYKKVLLDSSYYRTSLASDGAFYWRVKALNSSSASPFSAHSFYVDTTKPASPQLISPADGLLLSLGDTVEFQWSLASDMGSSLKQDLIWSRDSNFQSFVEIEDLKDLSFAVDSLSMGWYYWKVRSIDAAGNIGPYSVHRSFNIQ